MPRRAVRSTQTAPRAELDVRAIPELVKGGWRICGLEEVSLIGTVEKNYLIYGSDPFADATVGYIAKKAKREGHLECVTEEIISSIGHLLPISIAHSKLVRLPDTSPPDVRFMSKNFLHPLREQLIHGAELVASYLGSTADEMNKVFELNDPNEERRFYTVDFVVEVLSWWGRTPDERRRLHDGLGRLLAFDALIGAPDRHALNWGGIQSIEDTQRQRIFAPIYDTARGLFCEHREKRLEEFDAQGVRSQKVAKYADKSQPVFGCGDEGRRVNHFELIAYCLEQLPNELAESIRAVVHSYSAVNTERMLRRKFTKIISARRIAWIVDLLQVRSTRLKMLVE
jgi:hypothetical protein